MSGFDYIDIGFATENATVLPYIRYHQGLWNEACNKVQYQVSK